MLSMGKLVKNAPKPACRGKPGGKSPPVRKPAHHQADDTDIDDASAETADDAVSEIERPQIAHIGGKNPAAARQQRAERNKRTRTEPIDQIGLKRREPGLQNDQERKRPLQ